MSDEEDDAPIIMPNGVDFDDDDLNDDDLPEEEQLDEMQAKRPRHEGGAVGVRPGMSMPARQLPVVTQKPTAAQLQLLQQMQRQQLAQQLSAGSVNQATPQQLQAAAAAAQQQQQLQLAKQQSDQIYARFMQ